MLQSLQLENFKAFGERTRIPFAPITLIFGENSAGKSTILQALYLLKQTRESRETGVPLLPRTENGIVDLGSFQEMIFDHDLSKMLSVRIETNDDREIAIEFGFKRPSLEEEVRLAQIQIYDRKSAECIAKFQPVDAAEDPESFWRRMGYLPDLSFRDLPPPSKLPIVECVCLTKEPRYWKSEFEWWKKNKAEILNRIKERKTHLEQSLDHQTDKEKEIALRDLGFLNANYKLLSSNFNLKTYISEKHKEKINTGLRVQGFLPDGIMTITRNDWITGSHSFIDRQSDDAEFFDVGELTMQAGRTLEQTLDAFFPMGPFRRAPERWYIFRGTSPQDVGYRGDLLPDLLFRRRGLVTESNKWLRQLGIGYKLEMKSLGDRSRDLFEVRLIDTHRKGKEDVDVALPDVGFGISQLLPFIVQSLVSEKRIISIEQPEVHVHPRLQADLGDLLAEAIKEPRQNQFIVETHSEHLILRLQSLVRKKKIKPSDISIIYVNRGSEGAESQRLRLDEDGDFIDDWPGGFFPERLLELR